MPDNSPQCGQFIDETDIRCDLVRGHACGCKRGKAPVGGVQFYDDKHERRLVIVESVEDAKQIIKNSRKGSVANH